MHVIASVECISKKLDGVRLDDKTTHNGYGQMTE